MWTNIKNMRTKDTIAILSIVGVIGLLVLLQIHPIPDSNKDVVNIAVGTLLGGLVARIAGHYFPGSTKTDKDNGTTTV